MPVLYFLTDASSAFCYFPACAALFWQMYGVPEWAMGFRNSFVNYCNNEFPSSVTQHIIK